MKFDSSFTFLFQFGSCGSGDGQFGFGGVGPNSDEVVGPTAMTVNPASDVTATTPAGKGLVPVTVGSPGGTSAIGKPQVQFIYPPIVVSIVPDRGPAAGGTHVVIRGANMCQATGVDFGKKAAARFSVSAPSKGVCHVLATSPPGAGTVHVTVRSPGGPSIVAPHKFATFAYY